ncbi:MAG: hypothetical protein ACI80K_001386, partial [Paracoccaceae bacterium]
RPRCGTAIVSAVVDISDDTLGNAYCAPAIPNSTGAPASLRLEGAPGTLASGQVSLVAAQLPEASAGYFLASLTQDSVPGAGGSQGTLCLSPRRRDVVFPSVVPRCQPNGDDELHSAVPFRSTVPEPKLRELATQMLARPL